MVTSPIREAKRRWLNTVVDALGVTQREVAERLGLPYANLNAMLNGEDMIDAGGYAGAALRADMAKDRPGPEQPPQAPEPNQVLGLGRDGQSQATSIAHPAQNHRSKSRWWSWSDFTTRLVVAVVILLLTWFVMWLSTGKVG